MSNGLRIAGRVVGILLILLAVSFNVERSHSGDETRTVYRVGAWFSPWYVRTSVELPFDQPGLPPGLHATSATTESRVNFLAGAWLPLAAGIALLVVCRRRKPTADAAS